MHHVVVQVSGGAASLLLLLTVINNVEHFAVTFWAGVHALVYLIGLLLQTRGNLAERIDDGLDLLTGDRIPIALILKLNGALQGLFI